MFKLGLAAIFAISFTLASAQAFDNSGSERAAVAFGLYGVQGLAMAGRASGAYGAFESGISDVGSASGPYGNAYVGSPAGGPVCFTEHLTSANANTLVNVTRTVCR